MVAKVRMPRIDANVDEGTIGRWLVNPGEPVAVGQPLVEIITDKATFELEAERSGTFGQAVATEKSVVPVGFVIALVREEEGEALPDVAEENAATMEAYRAALLSGGRLDQREVAVSVDGPGERGVRATPAARRLAREEGIPLADLSARKQGVLQRADVERELERLRGGGT